MSETSGSRGPQLRVRLYWHTLVPSEVLAEEEDAPLAVMLADAGAPTVLAPGHLMQICRLAPVILAHWRLCWQIDAPAVHALIASYTLVPGCTGHFSGLTALMLSPKPR